MKRRKGSTRNENEKTSKKAQTKSVVALSTSSNVSDANESEYIDLKSFVVVNDEELKELDADSDESETWMRKSKRKNMIILIFLYFLQGLPLGLTGAIPLLMSAKKVSYASQGTFSFAFWPFTIKLLWKCLFIHVVYLICLKIL